MKPIPVYPVAMAISFVAVVYVQADVSAFGVLRSLAIVVSAVLFLQILLSLLLGGDRGAMATAVLVFLVHTGDPSSTALAALLIVVSIIAVRFAARIFRLTLKLRSVTSAMNLLTAMLALVIVIQAIATGRLSNVLDDVPEGQPLGNLPLSSQRSAAPSGSPDIYVLYLEDYPRADMLLRRVGLDDSAFVTALRQRGFSVAAHAHADYPYTDPNLASLLQMSVLQPPQGIVAHGSRTFRKEINHNPVYEALRNRDYQVIANLVRWEDVSQRSADFICGDEISNDFEAILLHESPARWLVPGAPAERGRLGAERGFDCAIDAVDRAPSGPKFVFSHLAATHLPVLFRADGSAADLMSAERPQARLRSMRRRGKPPTQSRSGTPTDGCWRLSTASCAPNAGLRSSWCCPTKG